MTDQATPAKVRLTDGLGPLVDSEEDPVRLWAEIHRLRAAVQGPGGFATWQDAAVAERVPLTDEQLLALLGDIDADTKRLPPGIKAFARAVEQAHGICAAGVKEPGNAGHQGREASPA